MKVLRRRDEFIKILSQSKKLRYPNRKAYGALDRQAKLQVRFTPYVLPKEDKRHDFSDFLFPPVLLQMESKGRSNFLTWLPDECWVSLHTANIHLLISLQIEK